MSTRKPTPAASKSSPAKPAPFPITTETRMVSLSSIFSEHNARTFVEGIDDLAASMNESGQIVPIVVVPVKDRFRLEAGHRRVAAAKKLGWTEIRAEIHHNVNALDARIRAFADNVGRNDLATWDMVAECAAIKKLSGMTGQEIGRRVGLNGDTVNNYVRVATKVDPRILREWPSTKPPVPVTFLQSLAALESYDEQKAAWEKRSGSSGSSGTGNGGAPTGEGSTRARSLRKVDEVKDMRDKIEASPNSAQRNAVLATFAWLLSESGTLDIFRTFPAKSTPVAPAAPSAPRAATPVAPAAPSAPRAAKPVAPSAPAGK